MPARYKIGLIFIQLILYFFVFKSSIYSSTAPTFSNLPSNINSDDVVEVDISFVGDPRYYKEKTYYLRGVFYQTDSKYCSFSQNNADEWISFDSDLNKLFEFTTNLEGSWSGKLKVKYDEKSSNCSGSGEYQFKVGRYTKSVTWSESQSLYINVPTPVPSPTSTPTPTPIPTSTSAPTSDSSSININFNQDESMSENPNDNLTEDTLGVVAGASTILSSAKQSTFTANLEIKPIQSATYSATLAAQLTPTEEEKIQEEESDNLANYFIIPGGGLLGAGVISFLIKRGNGKLKLWSFKK